MTWSTEIYRSIFARVYGALPLPCYFCGELVHEWGKGGLRGNVHHLDGDRSNNDPANLALAHSLCHLRHHNTKSEWNADGRTKLSERLKLRAPCSKCGQEYNPIWMTMHVTYGMCVDGTDAQRERRTRHYHEMGVKGGRGRKPGYEMSEEHRRAVGDAHRGRSLRPEWRAAVSAGLKRAWAEGRFADVKFYADGHIPKGYVYEKASCPDCGREISINNLARHRSACREKS